MNRTDSFSGIKYLKIKYTKVIPVYTKIDVAGSITCVDVAAACAAFAVVAVAVAAAAAADVVVLVEDIFTNKILYNLYIINLYVQKVYINTIIKNYKFLCIN
jgi:hypothetical protein